MQLRLGLSPALQVILRSLSYPTTKYSQSHELISQENTSVLPVMSVP